MKKGSYIKLSYCICYSVNEETCTIGSLCQNNDAKLIIGSCLDYKYVIPVNTLSGLAYRLRYIIIIHW